ncbi:MAG: hypothetical protein Q8910_08480, partial [Bacteroidota bacterium]|nr:hypothetical protein [Bacteroidota bacterium]
PINLRIQEKKQIVTKTGRECAIKKMKLQNISPMEAVSNKVLFVKRNLNRNSTGNTIVIPTKAA